MAAIITDEFRIANAELFKNSFSSAAYYMALGRTIPWGPTDISPSGSDVTPPNPEDSITNTNEAWQELIGAKKMFSADVTLAIPRNDWVTGTVYDEYDSAESALFQKKFYTITDEYNVYKCLSNNRGAPSTIKPTGTGTALIQTGDGYVWKYMYTPSSVAAAKFITPQFFPVGLAVSGDGSAQANVQDTAVSGAILSYKVKNGGSGYVSAPTVTVIGDGVGATAVAIVSGGEVVAVNINNAGSGYNYATVTIGGPGVGAEVQANIAPTGGHGKNAPYELGAFYVAMACRFEYGESGDITTENDYRRISIIRNPRAFGSPSVFSGTTARQTTRLTVTSALGYALDEKVIGNTSGASGYIVEVDTTNNYVYVNSVSGTFTLESLVGQTSMVSSPISAIQNPELQPFTGDTIYVETIKPQPRDTNQVERIISIVEW